MRSFRYEAFSIDARNQYWDGACLDTAASQAALARAHASRKRIRSSACGTIPTLHTNSVGGRLAVYWRSSGDLVAIPIGDLVAILFFAEFYTFRIYKKEINLTLYAKHKKLCTT